MPLYEEYLSYLKSEWADIKNAGSRWGGAVTAGIFLKQWVPEKVSWAHLDIAGVGFNEKEHNRLRRGARRHLPRKPLEVMRLHSLMQDAAEDAAFFF